MKINPLYLSDGYKPGHKAMLAPGTLRLYGTLIPRSLKHAPKGIKKIVSFGQQMTWKHIHDAFEEHFFFTEKREHNFVYLNSGGTESSKMYDLEALKKKALQFARDMSLYLGAEYDGEHFEKLWDLGYLPLKIKSLPEGIETGPNIPHMTFINTVDGFAWLTLYMETIVSNLSWKASTAATIARLYRKQAEQWVTKTDPENLWLVDFMCHDFSARGLSGEYDMMAVGLGHATSFKGSDTLATIPASRYYYNEPEDSVCIFSVNASEHSVSTTKIFTVGEKQMLSDWMKIFPKGILSVVSDTFDLWKLITEYLPALKEEIMGRDGKLVIRPDSGNPVDIVCGKISEKLNSIQEIESFLRFFYYESDEKKAYFLYNGEVYSVSRETLQESAEEYGTEQMFEFSKDTKISDLVSGGRYSYLEKEKISESEAKGVIELLWEIFGGTTNEQGYKILDPHIGAIYGDSITPERQRQIYKRLAKKGFAATNIVLGVGSFTYQYNTRDTLGFAVKGAWFQVGMNRVHNDNGRETEWVERIGYDIYKDPVTDDGTKKSLKGLLKVYTKENRQGEIEYLVKTECSVEEENEGVLQLIYEDGNFYNQTSLTEVRERLKSTLQVELPSFYE